MKFRNLFDFKNISRFLVLALVIFLFLPLIFPENNDFKILKKESVYSHEDSPLPIFPKENILDKYVHKVKKFYKMDTPVFVSANNQKTPQILKNNGNENEDEKGPNAEIASQNTDISAGDLFFSADYEDDIDTYSTAANSPTKPEDNTVNLQKGTVLTRDGLTLEPTQEGYYYDGKFYKNGTYPANANRKYIEGALSRYHSRIAKNLGKKALYFADEKGNLTVSYEDNLPNEFSTDIDTYLAQNRNRTAGQTKNYSKTDNSTKKYDNTKPNLDNSNVTASDVAIASLKDMHAAYNLLNSKIKNGGIGQGIDINKPFQNSFVNSFLNSNNNNIPNEITPNNPSEEPLPPSDPEVSETIVAGDPDFAQNYADKIHQLNCGSEISIDESVPQINMDNIINVVPSGALSCDSAPLIVEPSSTITNNIPQESDFDIFKDKLNEITTQSNKTDINIISTDRNFYPVAAKLNEEQSIRNTKDQPVTVHIIGPSETENNLSKVLEGVTYSLTDDVSVAKTLTDHLDNFYSLSEEENDGTHTILAFPTDDEKQVFILTDPNNSYWLKNPKQLENYPVQYMEKNGVYYQGIVIDKTQVGKLVSEEKTNLLYISDQESTHYLPNGSALTTVTEDDVKINSLHPEQIQKNTKLVETLTKQGQKNLEKNQPKEPQPIVIKDYEKGDKIIQPKK